MTLPMIPAELTASSYLESFCAAARTVDMHQVDALADVLAQAYDDDRMIFFVGNGGSAANASHFCEDLGKGTVTDFEHQKRLRVLSLTDNTAYILAWGNDASYEHVFVEQLKNLATPGDLLVAISGSGNSPNILRCVEYANAHAMITIGITGFDGGALRRIAQHGLHVPCTDMGMAETVHAIYFHYLVDTLRERFRGR